MFLLLLWILPFSASGLTEAFLEQHCYECHDADAKKGRLDLTALEFNSDTTPVWIKIHDVVERGEMPPKKKKRPDPTAAKAFLSTLDAKLLAATSTAETGRIRMRRMTRREFENTLCDLMALPRLDVAGMLPADGRVAGYDKIAGGLDLSPGHLAAYQEAVEKALDAAIATRSAPPPVYQKRVYPAGLFKFGGNLIQGQYVLLKDKQPDPALPVRGGFEDKTGHVGHDGPDIEERRHLVKGDGVARSQSAVGLLNPNLAGYEAALNVSPVYAGIYRLKVSLWGFHWNQGRPVECPTPQAGVLRAHEEGKQQEGGRLLRAFTAPSMQSEETEFTTFLNSHESIVFDPVSIPWNGLRIGQVAGRAAKHAGPGVAVDWFEIEGPLHPSWPPESHKRLFGGLPIRTLPAGDDSIPPRREVVRSIPGYLPNLQKDFPPHERNPVLETVHSEQPEEDGRQLLSAFLPRAFRREIRPAEIAPYIALLKARLLAKDCFEDAMRRVYVAVLTSPEFLFQPADTKDGRGLFSDKAGFTLASRLSYWLWNGPPDEELLARARDESLPRPAVLRAQIDRLLADPRSGRFIEDFTDQWLELNRLEETTPDPQLYPEYRFLLHEGMAAESRAFIRTLLTEDLPIGSLLKPGFAMLTQRLAEHYGVAGVRGVEVRKVPLQPREIFRGGLLGQAAIHKLTANGTTTSPVKRGVWVMDRLLNSPAPPPPPGISLIDPDTRGTTTVREQLDRHRHDANCAACHAKIDPPGFALESFDPIGGLRERYRSNGAGDEPPEKGKTPWRVQYKLGPTVDPSGTLSDGRVFESVATLNRLLLGDEQRLAEAFVAHLSRYATGTDVGYADRAEIRRIVESTSSGGYRVRALLHALGSSRLLLSEPSQTPR
jgi:mono/diheme cytochrome c family protein